MPFLDQILPRLLGGAALVGGICLLPAKRCRNGFQSFLAVPQPLSSNPLDKGNLPGSSNNLPGNSNPPLRICVLFTRELMPIVLTGCYGVTGEHGKFMVSEQWEQWLQEYLRPNRWRSRTDRAERREITTNDLLVFALQDAIPILASNHAIGWAHYPRCSRSCGFPDLASRSLSAPMARHAG